MLPISINISNEESALPGSSDSQCCYLVRGDITQVFQAVECPDLLVRESSISCLRFPPPPLHHQKELARILAVHIPTTILSFLVDALQYSVMREKSHRFILRTTTRTVHDDELNTLFYGVPRLAFLYCRYCDPN